ncbi:hypothetical protein Ddc_22543 [Ditylenchus destructor]|nr:hypothetical protein Ddc_22543 [Ditylenchus destructor]
MYRQSPMVITGSNARQSPMVITGSNVGQSPIVITGYNGSQSPLIITGSNVGQSPMVITGSNVGQSPMVITGSNVSQSPMVVTAPPAISTIQSCYPAGKVFTTRTSWQIRQVSFLGDMIIRDAGGAPVFKAVSEWGDLKDLSFVDMRIGRSVARIEDEWRCCAPLKYQIFLDGGNYGSVEMDKCCFRTNFYIESRDGPIDIIGDFWILSETMSYDFVRENQQIAQVRKRANAVRDTYNVDIEPGEDVVFILACCVIIDKCTTPD